MRFTSIALAAAAAALLSVPAWAHQFGKIDAAKRTSDFVASAQWLKAHPLSNGRVAVTGFCFGGGMSNNLATLLGADLAAAAPFYGGAPWPRET